MAKDITWISTTKEMPWQEQGEVSVGPVTKMPDVFIQLDHTGQIIEGFGANFSELGWQALSALSDEDRKDVMRMLFEPGVGTSFTLCRMPVGANDFAIDWYSYDEVEGDFGLDNFSIDHDRQTLIPFITLARQYQPNLQLWASPWSPPTWMKTNHHYASVPAGPFLAGVDNGVQPDQIGVEGTDMMIQDDAHLDAYARYFGRFIDAYRSCGIDIGMVMPQNEFNSPQPFPSCTWTPEGLARFIRHLGPQMEERGVEVFLGTLERANEDLLEATLADPEAARHVAGVGFQWAGKGAIAGFHSRHPELRVYQTEQECGDGGNTWKYARYAWRLMKHYLTNGANAYMYWNIALEQGGRSTWGWTQNSLVVVDAAAGTYRYTHEFYLLRHVAQFVQEGAYTVEAMSLTGQDNVLAFANPDGSLVVVVHNDMGEDDDISLLVGDKLVEAHLKADSFNTFVIPAGA